MKNAVMLLAHSNNSTLHELKTEIKPLKHFVQKETTSGIRALRFILRDQPELAILDLNFKDISVFEIIKEIRSKKIDTKCVLLFNQENKNSLFLARTLQVDACVYVKESLQDLQSAIQAVCNDRFFISDTLSNISNVDSSITKLEALTHTEVTILALIGIYKTSSKISEKLMTSVRTVEKHRSNIIKKLNLHQKSLSLNYWAIKNQDIIHSFAFQKVS